MREHTYIREITYYKDESERREGREGTKALTYAQSSPHAAEVHAHLLCTGPYSRFLLSVFLGEFDPAYAKYY